MYDDIKPSAESQAEAERILATFPRQRRADGTQSRTDAGETATFARALEFIKKETYDVKYAALKLRTFVPKDGSIPSGAESFTYRSWDWRGMAKIVESHSDDLPTVSILGKEVPSPIKSLGAAYGYSIQDVRAAALMGVPLDAKKGAAVRRVIENAIEEIGAEGNADANLPGFINNSNVPLITNATSGFTGDWLNPATTALEILADLHLIANTVATQSKHIHSADTMIVPASHYLHIATKPISDLQPENTVLKVFLATNPTVRFVDQWHYLDDADEAGTGPRVVCYERNPEVLGLVVPQEFEQLPAQPKNLGFHIPCHARIGGVQIRYPLGMVYADLAA